MGRQPVEYFARWDWVDGVGLEPLTDRRAARIHDRGGTYVVHLTGERLILTLRGETRFVDLGFSTASGERLAGVALILDEKPAIESIDVYQHGEEVVLLQGGERDNLTVTIAPFDEPEEFRSKALPAIRFPAFGDYGMLAKLPRDPWAYVEVPAGFAPPRPTP